MESEYSIAGVAVATEIETSWDYLERVGIVAC